MLPPTAQREGNHFIDMAVLLDQPSKPFLNHPINDGIWVMVMDIRQHWQIMDNITQ